MSTINAVNIEGTLKRSAVVVALAAMLFALLGVIAPASSNAASGASASSAVKCKLVGARKVVCPTNKLRGPRGPAGATGATGPAGPAGPAGPGSGGTTAVKAFKFLAIGNTPNTTITTLTGAVAEAGCDGNDFTNPRLRATADNGAAHSLNLRTGSEDFQPDFDISAADQVNLVPGNNDDQFGLTYMSTGGVQNVSAHYSADDTGASIAGVFDCAIWGTIQVNG